MLRATKRGRGCRPVAIVLGLVLAVAGCSSPVGTTPGGPNAGGAAAPAVPTSRAWSFGVISDTQWIGTDDGNNPNSCAVSIIKQIDQQFIAKGVKAVVAIGDLVDTGNAANEDVRATYAQDLYNAGIAFYPLRGNHDSSAAVAAEFVRLYPQTKSGVNNQTPADAFAKQSTDLGVQPAAINGSTFTFGGNFSSPSAALAGLSYSFDYNNARFVLLDQFDPSKGTTGSIATQQSWISGQLSGRAAGSHAFVFSHKGIITENHADNLFGSNPGADKTGEDAFIASLAQNKVHFYVGGHDHMHDRTMVATSDGASAKIMELVTCSDSSKFYIPKTTANDDTYDNPLRQTALAQELNTVGYYIFTVDGDNVTVDFYSAVVNPTLSGGEYVLAATPAMSFTLRESFGYGLNGKEFIVAQGDSLTVVQDTYAGSGAVTAAKILGGSNANTQKDGSNRPFSLSVDTGWTSRTTGLYSDILTLWGMGYTLGSKRCDPFPLSLSYSGTASDTTGKFGLLRLDAAGAKWVNAVSANASGSPQFHNGPWSAAYGLGSYGIDTTTTPPTAWAVIDTAGTFAVGPIN